MTLLREVWSILTPAQRRSVLAAQAISLVMAFSTVTGIAAIAPFFAVLGNPRLIETNRVLDWAYVHGGFSSNSGFAVALGAGFIALVIVANLINVLGFLAMNRRATRIGNELKASLFEEYLSRPYLFHVRTHSAELFDRIVHETARVRDGVLQNAFLLVTNAVTAMLIAASMLAVMPGVGLVVILGLGGGYLAIYLFVRKGLLRTGHAHSHAWTEQARVVSESFGGIREILLLRDRGPICDEFVRVSRTVGAAASHVKLAAQLPRHIMECLAVAALVIVALLFDRQSRDGAAWLGRLTFVGFAAYRLLPILQQVFASIVKIRADRAAFALIAPDLQSARRAPALPHSHRDVPARQDVPADPSWFGRPREGIRVEHVSFRYSPAKPWALDDVSVHIPSRCLVGLVGPNGSGKTTLLDLIAGLLAPERGNLHIDELRLIDANHEQWQERVAYVPQEVFLLDASIARNIAFGVPAPEIDRARMVRAARMARLEEFVSTLADGYEHRVGERGIELSGGERQRVGIARALYREASMLLLDEPASALDGASEAQLVDTLRSLRGECTIVLVSHRLSAVRSCDVIHQLDRGQLLGSGTYDELVSSSALFRRLSGA